MLNAAVGRSVHTLTDLLVWTFFCTELGKLKEVRSAKCVKVSVSDSISTLLLHQDGIISVKDIDLVMSEGLGMRYAFIGPMETMHLNAPAGNVPTLDHELKTSQTGGLGFESVHLGGAGGLTKDTVEFHYGNVEL